MPALIGATITGFGGFAVLIPSVPLWAVGGGASEAGAGFVNGVLLLFTVLTQLLVPPMLRRFGWGATMSVGMLLLGLPSLLFPLSDALALILALSAVRGVGFGILTVTGGAAVAELVEPARRGKAIGAYGLAIALPNLVLLPVAPYIAETWGFIYVFLLGALPLLGIPSVMVLGRVLHDPPAEEPVVEDAGPITGGGMGSARGDVEGMTQRAAYLALLRPTTILLGATLSGGALVTFAPQMVDSASASTAALFGIGLTAAVARWGAGGLADRYGCQPFMWPLALLTVFAMALAAWSVNAEDPSALVLAVFVAAVCLVGVSYGGLQNLTMTVAFQVVGRSHIRLASAVWNIGFDLGTGLGSVLVGLLAAGYGFGTALAISAVISACTLPLALRRARPR